MRVTILGLSITSSWGNGHATIFRALCRALGRRGHDVLFLERDVPWYAAERDDPSPEGCRVALYDAVADLDAYAGAIAESDLVIVGSYVPEGIAVGRRVLSWNSHACYYDIDTPVTLARLERDDCVYLDPGLIERYAVFLSFTGGPLLERLVEAHGAPRAEALYCCVDPDRYAPEPNVVRDLDLGYMGTYSDDRQPKVDRLLLEPAGLLPEQRFALAGPMYPDSVRWPENVERAEHLPPDRHRRFYNRQRWTLNITRADMVETGFAPSVRLFEAAACGTPILSDPWPGLETFFPVGSELITVASPADVVGVLRDLPEPDRLAVAKRARARCLRDHTADARVDQLEALAASLRPASTPARRHTVS